MTETVSKLVQRNLGLPPNGSYRVVSRDAADILEPTVSCETYDNLESAQKKADDQTFDTPESHQMFRAYVYNSVGEIVYTGVV